MGWNQNPLQFLAGHPIPTPKSKFLCDQTEHLVGIFQIPGHIASSSPSRFLSCPRSPTRRKPEILPCNKQSPISGDKCLSKMAANIIEIKKGKKKQCTEVEGDDKSYMRWTLEMEVALANILRDQRNIGNKGDIGWKPVAYNTASHLLSAQFKDVITPDNVRNRVKTWRRFYGVVSDILSQKGFSWDSTKKIITFDDENAWKEYCKATPKAKSFKFKVIPNWDDIVDLCGKDKAIGELAKTAEEADDVMSANEEANEFSGTQALDNMQVNEDNTPTSTQSRKKRSQSSSSSAMPSWKKRVRSKDALAKAVDRMASSLEKYLLANTKKLDAGVVYDEVNGVPGLEEEQRLKACVWFMENEKQFELLKKLPIEKKANFIFMLIR